MSTAGYRVDGTDITDRIVDGLVASGIEESDARFLAHWAQDRGTIMRLERENRALSAVADAARNAIAVGRQLYEGPHWRVLGAEFRLLRQAVEAIDGKARSGDDG